MIKTTPVNSVRVVKVGVTFHFHFSDCIVYKGECWCIRGRNYEYGQPLETANGFLQSVTKGCLNSWTEHMKDTYDIQVDKNKVNPSTEVQMEYQCIEDMTLCSSVVLRTSHKKMGGRTTPPPKGHEITK